MVNNCWLGKPVRYEKLSGKEQESYNTAHLQSLMADWGYLECARVNGDKHGADLLFYRSTDSNVLKVQLKGRPTLNKSYAGKGIYVAFEDKQKKKWYVYDHDVVMNAALDQKKMTGTQSWEERGSWSWSYQPRWLENLLKDWEIPQARIRLPMYTGGARASRQI